MILILISIISGIVLTGMLFGYAGRSFRTSADLAGMLGVLLALGCGVASIVYAMAGFAWFSAKYKSEIVNREYGTNYTHEEIFWASSVVDTIRELDRKRYEVNGDFRRGNADTKAQRDQRSHGQEQEK
jgi:cytochrome b subunit of formate dehydrogenase